jgi:DNA polymerase V
VYDLRSVALRDSSLKTLPIEEIWGIGRKLTEKLQQYSIKNAFDLQQANPKIMRRRFSVVVERIILELNGISCLGLESVVAKKQIMCSRSFGRPITNLHDLSSALSRYTARAACKLRGQACKAQAIYVFITTNKHKTSDRQYTKGLASSLVMATNDTRVLITAAQQVLKQLYKTGFNYKKAGILLMDIIPNHQQPKDLFIPATSQRSAALMQVLNETNKNFGSHTLFFAAEADIHASWTMRSGYRSPRYTTHWQELASVKA